MKDLFKALNDGTRRDILSLLKNGDLTSGEIADHFSITKPSISHHLELLRKADLVYSKKRGQYVIYSINTSVMDDLLNWILTLKNAKK